MLRSPRSRAPSPRSRSRALPLIAVALALSSCERFLETSGYTGEVRAVPSVLETPPVPSSEDAADDPAIWVHPRDPALTRVLGTDKQSGVYVYDLAGTLLEVLAVGPVNNVDVRTTANGVFAVASHGGRQAVAVFTIARETGDIAFVGEFATSAEQPYGICLGTREGRLAPVVTYRNGTVQFFEVALDHAAPSALQEVPHSGARFPLPATLVRTLDLGGQLEGCVIDEAHGRLFVGEEARGIWVVELDGPHTTPTLIADVTDGSGLVADVEGLALWKGDDGTGWLVASAQGANRFVVFERNPPYSPRGVFRLRASSADTVDAVSNTDGIDIAAADLGPRYPRGLLVVQDGENTQPRANQNFKFVDWREVEAALDLPALRLP